MRLKNKTILYFAACALGPLILGIAVSFHSATRALEAELAASLANSVVRELRDLDDHLTHSESLLETMADVEIMQDVLIGDDSGEIRNFLGSLNVRRPEFSSYVVTDDSGAIVASTLVGLPIGEFATSATLAAVYEGDILVERTVIGGDAHHDAVIVGVPIKARYDRSLIIGALFGIIDWQLLRQLLSQSLISGEPQGENRVLLITDGTDGHMLYVTPSEDAKHWADRLVARSGDTQISRISPDDGRRSNKAYVVSSASSSNATLSRDLDWVFHIAIADDIAQASIAGLRSNIVVFATTAALLSMALCWYGAGTVTGPLTQMIKAMRLIAAGDENASIPSIRRGDEVGEMAAALADFHRTKIEIRLTKEREQEQRKARLAAEAAERAKSEFLATMSHEIRTPLNGVLGISDLLAETRLDDRQSKFVETIRASGRALLSIINDVLDFSRIEAGAMVLDRKAFALSRIAKDAADVINRQASEKGLEVMVRIQPGLPAMVVGDEGRLRQVLINLMGNAVKFTEVGQIVLSISGDTVDDASGSRVRIRAEVRDTGIGIPEERLDAIFDKFTQVDSSATRKFQGTGLGLSICKALINLMGGEIGVESAFGAGSTFWLTLELPVAQVQLPEIIAPLDLRGKRALIVDDNDTNRLILRELMTAWGFEHHSAASGEQALQLLSDLAGEGRPIDFVVMDYHMPGMSGIEATRRIRMTPAIADTPVVILSSIDDSFADDGDGGARADGYLTKPAHAADLLDMIAATLAKQAPGNGPAETDNATVQIKQEPASSENWPDTLIVEDNETNRFVVTEILKRIGYTFAVAEDGADAVEKYSDLRPRIILMDVSMPILNGYEATKKIRVAEAGGNGSRTPIIGLTANAMEGDREKCLHAGMDDYLAKPFSANELSSMLEKWLPRYDSMLETGPYT